MAGTGAHDPLLLPAGPSGCRVEEEDGWRWDLAAAEAKRLLRLAGPLVGSCLLQAAINILSLMFVGHLGELPLAGASLATSIANVTGFSLLVSCSLPCLGCVQIYTHKHIYILVCSICCFILSRSRG
jgi:MATE family multidrug resistance protein